jgi:transcriptional regulator with XRE-family HTH domain
MSRSNREKQQLQELLRELRDAADLRQIDLAKRLGRPQSFVSKYESGEKNLDFLEVREVCEALGVPLVEFVRRFERKASK